MKAKCDRCGAAAAAMVPTKATMDGDLYQRFECGSKVYESGDIETGTRCFLRYATHSPADVQIRQLALRVHDILRHGYESGDRQSRRMWYYVGPSLERIRSLIEEEEHQILRAMEAPVEA